MNCRYASWHVFCIFGFLSGCLYVEPGWSPELNLPPEILAPAQQGEGVLDLDQFSQVMVTVRESDGDRIWFFWTYPDDTSALTIDVPNDEGVWSSMLRVQNKTPALDGRRISVQVVDEATPANRVELSWLIKMGAQ